MEIEHRLYIGGRFVPAEDGATLPSLNPHDNTPVAAVWGAGKADSDKAVDAARAAFPKWSRTAAAERGRLLLKLAERMEEHAEELARLETLDTGHPLRDTRALDAPRTAATFRYFGGMADKFEGSVLPVEAGVLHFLLHGPPGGAGLGVPRDFPPLIPSREMHPARPARDCAA